MRFAVALFLCCAGCHAERHRDPVAAARALVHAAARALAAGDDRQLDAEVMTPATRPPEVGARPDADGAERKQAVARLDAAAAGGARAYARAHAHGPLATEAVLEHTSEGWRVDPRTVNVVLPTPGAALLQLVAALDRLPSDPALALLSRAMRDSIVSAAAERSRGLRQLIDHLPTHVNGRLPLQLEYGQGFFVVLKTEDGGWRIDDFN